MQSVLVSFLGKGQPAKGGRGARFSGYQRASYQFDDVSDPIASTFFGYALFQHLARTGRTPDRWVILGTASSAWDTLADVMEDHLASDESLFEALSKWQQTARKQLDSGMVTDDVLLAFPLEMARTAGIRELDLAIIEPGAAPEGQEKLAQTLLQHIPEGARVTLDITHSFRHLPVIAAFTLQVLQWLRDIVVADIFYGAFDQRKPESDLVPVVNVEIAARHARLSASLAAHKLTGRMSPMAVWFGEHAELARQVDHFEATNRIDRLRSTAQKLKNTQGAEEADTTVEGVARQACLERLDYARERTLPERMLSRAEGLVETGDYLLAVTLIFEAMVLYAMIHLDFSPDFQSRRADESECAKDYLHELLNQAGNEQALARYHQVRQLRNAMLHNSKAKTQQVRDALESPDAMERLLTDGLLLARNLIQGQYGRIDPEDFL
jgi:CRISPR-associated Csx2 family protein